MITEKKINLLLVLFFSRVFLTFFYNQLRESSEKQFRHANSENIEHLICILSCQGVFVTFEFRNFLLKSYVWNWEFESSFSRQYIV